MIDNDAYSWSEERTKDEISALLPEGWAFHFGHNARGYWEATFVDENDEAVWADSFPASNVLLLNAYGWIALRRTPRKAGTWGPRRELTLREVNAEALRRARDAAPDPEDVVPDELASVYQSKPTK